MASSVKNSCVKGSPLILSFMWDSPCSFNVNPNSFAACLTRVLNSLLPVKYNNANGYSFGGLYKKSMRRIGMVGLILTRVKHLTFPFDNTSAIVPS